MRPNTSWTFRNLSRSFFLFRSRETWEEARFMNGEFLWEGIIPILILMGIIINNNKNIKIKGEIEKVNGKELSYSEFVDRYMDKNKPVVLTGLMDHHWRACTDWVTSNEKPNLQFFFNHFGSSKVQVLKLLLLNWS